MIIEEHARLEIFMPNENNWREIKENGIIQNSLSVTKKCMDDSSFSLGGVYSAQLSAKIRVSGDGINTYTLTGSKVKVYSQYDSQSEILRGVFWITSVSRIKDIYTISGSDALVWLDGTSYDDSSTTGNKIYSILASDRGNLGYKFNQILEAVNGILDEDKKFEFCYDSGIVNYDANEGFCVLSSDMVGEVSIRNPRDYASWLAELACGFVYMDYTKDEENGKFRIGQFGEDITNEISIEETELNSCEIADFVVQADGVWTNVYDGTFGGYGNWNGKIVIDISDNPFKDGHWQYNGGSAMDIIDNIDNKLRGIGENCHGLDFRPFKLKCHCNKIFELGQKVRLPDSNHSWITSIKWQFRGGYTLSCAGKDTRVLYASARRSQSAKVKDLAYTKINTEVAKINNKFSNEDSTGTNDRLDRIEESNFQQQINYLQSEIEAMQLRIDELEGSQ